MIHSWDNTIGWWSVVRCNGKGDLKNEGCVVLGFLSVVRLHLFIPLHCQFLSRVSGIVI